MTQVFHSDVNNVVPWQANYSFPSQTTKSEKTMIKLEAKNGKATYGAHDTIRFEFPSDQYLNALNTQIAFDVKVTESGGKPMSTQVQADVDANGVVTLAAGVANRATENYYRGYIITFSSDIQGVAGKTLQIRNQTDAGVLTFVGTDNVANIVRAGNYSVTLRNGTRLQPGGAHALFKRIKITYGGMVLEDINDYNVIARYLVDTGLSKSFQHGSGAILEGMAATHLEDTKHNRLNADALVCSDEELAASHLTLSSVDNWKRICFKPFAGLLNCKKLIPLKWMASSLSVELTVARDEECIIAPLAALNATAPKIAIQKPRILAELINFDSTYDTGFYYGMQQFGVPLRFSTWSHTTINPTGSNHMMQIHSRARSIKMAIAAVRDAQSSYLYDSGRFYQAVTNTLEPQAATPENPTPVSLRANGAAATSANCGRISEYQWRIGGRYWPAQPVDCSNGGAEAYVELLKTMDALGDYTFANNIDPKDWHTDYDVNGGNKFVMAARFEMADLNPDTISGINGEEQSDIMLQIKAESAFQRKTCEVFLANDALLIIRPENSVELVY